MCVCARVCVCQYTEIVEPVLNAIEAITLRSQLTLSSLAAAANDAATDAAATHSLFHTLEVRRFLQCQLHVSSIFS